MRLVPQLTTVVSSELKCTLDTWEVDAIDARRETVYVPQDPGFHQGVYVCGWISFVLKGRNNPLIASLMPHTHIRSPLGSRPITHTHTPQEKV